MEHTFLVTGAAGFIGSHSVDLLLASGHAVIGLDNLRTGRLANLEQALRSGRFTFVEGDAADEATVDAVFAGRRIDGVLHLAALVSVPESFREPALNFRTNVAATDVVARACLRHGCPRVVFASSAAVYGDRAELPNRESAAPQPMSPYAAAKLASEELLLGYAASYGLHAVCFRYFNVYGVRQDPGSPYSGVLSIFTDRFAAGLPVTVYGDGEQTRDFVSVHDVARANATALIAEAAGSGRFNVCTGVAVSLNRVLDVYRRLYPSSAGVAYAEARVGDIRHSCGDAGALAKRFDVRARVEIEAGLGALVRGESLS